MKILTKTLTLRLTASIDEALRRRAVETHQHPTALARAAIERFLAFAPSVPAEQRGS
jgi:hypothetical protein